MAAGQRRNLIRFLLAQDNFVQADTTLATDSFEGFQPLRIHTAWLVRPDSNPPNAFSLTFPQAIIYGIIGTVASFSLSVVNERNRGTLDRLRALPVSLGQILAGKALGCFMTTALVTVLLVAAGRALFGVRITSVPLLMISIFAVSTAFVGIMMLFAVSSNSERTVSGIAWGVLLPLTMVGGGMIPLAFMPAWLRRVSDLSPVKWAILSLEGALWRGLSTRQMLLPWGVLVAIGTLAFFAGARVFTWKKG